MDQTEKELKGQKVGFGISETKRGLGFPFGFPLKPTKTGTEPQQKASPETTDPRAFARVFSSCQAAVGAAALGRASAELLKVRVDLLTANSR